MYYVCKACDEIIGRDNVTAFGMTLAVCNNCQVVPKRVPARPAWLSLNKMDIASAVPAPVNYDIVPTSRKVR